MTPGPVTSYEAICAAWKGQRQWQNGNVDEADSGRRLFCNNPSFRAVRPNIYAKVSKAVIGIRWWESQYTAHNYVTAGGAELI
jgi:hypothetical protein